MTASALYKVAKAKGIDLSQYDEVRAFPNEKYTFINVTFAVRENLGGNAYRYQQRHVKVSIRAIQKREEFEDDYQTRDWWWQWISDIKAKHN